jgi:uncharacterized protein (TIGR03435 family)
MRKMIVIAAVTAGILAAQSFDVASVRMGEGRGKFATEITPASVTMEGTVAQILGWAYELKRYQIAGPDWLKAGRCRIVAKSERPATVAEMRRMMQSLVAERFKMVSHREQREMWVYALVAAKGGTKLKESSDEGDSLEIDNKKLGTGGTLLRTTTAQFADQLDGSVGPEPVVDQTGIAGKFDITLDLTEAMRGMKPGDDFPSILIEELRRQLGLNLERRKMTVQVMVVDKAVQTPSEN